MTRYGAAFLVLWAAGCGPAAEPPAAVRPAPRTIDVSATGSRPMPPPLRAGGRGYPDAAAIAPIYLVPEVRWSPIGGSNRETRTLTGRAASFSDGVELLPASVPLRVGVWPYPATPVAATADSVAFATPWLPVARFGGAIQCQSPASAAGRPEVRLVGVYRFATADLEVEGWLEARGGESCVGSEVGRDRLHAFMDDLDMFARAAARRTVPVPIPRW
jgi:hypothetical protein